MNTLPRHPLTAQARLDTPLGPMTVAATDDGIAGLWFDGQAHHPGTLQAPERPEQRWIALLRGQLAAYFADPPATARPGFELPLDLGGTDFQRAVWSVLRTVGAGHTLTYAEVARRAGRPAAVRAAGAAVGRNPVSIVVPCHRIVGREGALTGYAGGLDRKRALLRLEGVAA